MLYTAILGLCLALQAPIVPSTPDVSGWTRIASRDLEFRTDDYTVAFVGQIVDYQDPEDSHEFARVYLRHVVVLSERSRERGKRELAQTGADLRYHVAAQRQILLRAQQDSEPFLVMRWRSEPDARTGQDVLTGAIRFWLLDVHGEWTYRVGEKLTLSPLSEPSIAEPFGTRIVGLVFTLGDITHILRADPIRLAAPPAEGSDP